LLKGFFKEEIPPKLGIILICLVACLSAL